MDFRSRVVNSIGCPVELPVDLYVYIYVCVCLSFYIFTVYTYIFIYIHTTYNIHITHSMRYICVCVSTTSYHGSIHLWTYQFMKISSTLNQLKTWPVRTSGRPPIALGESPHINQPILGEEFLAFDRCISEVVANALPKVVLALLIASAVFVSSNPRVKATKVEMGTWAFMAAVVGREVFAEVCVGVNPVTSKLTLGDQTLNTYYFTKSPVAELSTFTGPFFPMIAPGHIYFFGICNVQKF